MSRFFSKKYAALEPYTPGEQPQDMQYVKLNTNESPFPPSEAALKYAAANTRQLNLYSDPVQEVLTKELAKTYGVGPDQIIVCNGSDETLNFAFMAFCDDGMPAAFADVTYGFYPVYAQQNRVPYVEVPLKEDFTMDVETLMGLRATLFIANPNSPTGVALPLSEIERLAAADPDRVVIVDEAYVDFGAESAVGLVNRYDNLLVIQTFSKSRSLAGGRLGYAIGQKELIGDLNTLKFSTNPYNVNSLTAAVGIGVLRDPEYMKKNCEIIKSNREYLVAKLDELGFRTLPSSANFVFTTRPGTDGAELYRALKEKGVLVRNFSKPRIKDYERITIGTREQLDVLIEKLKEILN